MSDDLISLFYSGADAVLANSGHEPFGLVGLEVMGAGGVAFVGSTGEDYAVPFLNAVVLDSEDPAEICIALQFLRDRPDVGERIRADAMETAGSFTWDNVLRGALLSKLKYVALRQVTDGNLAPGPSSPPDVVAGSTDKPKRPRRRKAVSSPPSPRGGSDSAYGGRSRPQGVPIHPPRSAD